VIILPPAAAVPPARVRQIGDLRYATCNYGVAVKEPLERCAMCGCGAWMGARSGDLDLLVDYEREEA